MSFAEMLEQLPTLTSEERKKIVDRVFELEEEEESFTPDQIALIERRMAEHEAHPGAVIPADEMFERLLNRFRK